MRTREKVPSLECLVNQCCEDYFKKLNESLDIQSSGALEVQQEGFFTYEQFEEYIKSSHCMENLKFLIEISHYEKIWNKTFKRQYSILKCKDESMQQQRKQSVATIFTNNSSFKRHMSIAEEPGLEERERFDSLHSLDHEDINKLVSELTLPHVVRSTDEIDTRSIVDQDATPKSIATQLEQGHSNHAHTTTQQQSKWGSLFKPSYCDNEYECICKSERSNSDIYKRSKSITPDEHDSAYEFNNEVKAAEIREQLKSDLSSKFHDIMTIYVLRNSPLEINLPNDIYNELVREYENTKILYHSPVVLLPAKNVVLQLLRENIYYKFLSQQEDLFIKAESIKSGKSTQEPSIAASTSPNENSKLSVIDSQEMQRAQSPNSLFTKLSQLKVSGTNPDSPIPTAGSIGTEAMGSDIDISSYVSGDSSNVFNSASSIDANGRESKERKHAWNRLLSFRKKKKENS
jgi:hypothetical protein